MCVKNRWFSAIGFITELDYSEKLRINTNAKLIISGNTGAILSSPIDTGYIFYFYYENGYVTDIEGFTYSEEWPEEIEKIETRYINLTQT